MLRADGTVNLNLRIRSNMRQKPGMIIHISSIAPRLTDSLGSTRV